MKGPSACIERGCENERIGMLNGVAWERCRPCAMGDKPARRRKAVAVAAVEALAPVAQPANGFAFRIPATFSENESWMLGATGRQFRHTDKAREWIEIVKRYARAAMPANWNPEGWFEMDLFSVFTSASADRDNPLKLTQDALKGMAWTNDNRVEGGDVRKDREPGNPQTVVTIRRVG